MAFVSEEITREKDIQYFNSLHLLDVTKRPLKPYWWAIDRERNYIIYPMGGGSFEIPQGMGLYLDGDIIEMWVKEKTNDRYNYDDLRVFWEIYKIRIPQKMVIEKYNEEEIVKIINEAFQGLGTSGIERSNIIEVVVTITTGIEYV